MREGVPILKLSNTLKQASHQPAVWPAEIAVRKAGICQNQVRFRDGRGLFHICLKHRAVRSAWEDRRCSRLPRCCEESRSCDVCHGRSLSQTVDGVIISVSAITVKLRGNQSDSSRTRVRRGKKHKSMVSGTRDQVRTSGPATM